jgi:hypothetical protein
LDVFWVVPVAKLGGLFSTALEEGDLALDPMDDSVQRAFLSGQCGAAGEQGWGHTVAGEKRLKAGPSVISRRLALGSSRRDDAGFRSFGEQSPKQCRGQVGKITGECDRVFIPAVFGASE